MSQFPRAFAQALLYQSVRRVWLHAIQKQIKGSGIWEQL